MTVLSLDLAARSYAENGLAILRADGEVIEAEFPAVAETLGGPPDAERLADFLIWLADDVEASLMLIDGPQAWKAPDTGLTHQRLCEKALHTPGKTGTPGIVKPGSWTRFAELSIALFDALAERGWPRLAREPTREAAPTRVALEAFPTAAWRSLRLRALPSKARCDRATLEQNLRLLLACFPLKLHVHPSHDELQALVAGLAGIALERGRLDFVEVAGVAPREIDGQCREGFIICPHLPESVLRVHRVGCGPGHGLGPAVAFD